MLQQIQGVQLRAQTSRAIRGPDSSQICRFHAYSDRVYRAPRAATTRNVLYRVNSTLVVQDEQDALSRYFLFLKPDGSCHEEGLVICRNVVDSRVDLPLAHGDNATSQCLARRCEPSPSLGLTYAKSMLGGALTGRPNATRALLLGVGAGMIPTWVQENLPGLSLDAVDIAPEVLGAAPCFGLRQGGNVHLFLRDGRSFIAEQHANSYDAVLMDVFTPQDRVPPCLSTLEFFKVVKTALRPGGALAINTWKQEHDQLLATVQGVFRDVCVGRAPRETNLVILATDGDCTTAGVTEGGKVEAREWFTTAGFKRADPRRGDSVWRDLARRDAEWCVSTAADVEASKGGSRG